MGKSVFLAAAVLALPVFFGGCSKAAPQAVSAQQPAAKAPEAAAAPAAAWPEKLMMGRAADDAARFLAGMPGKAGSPFAELEKDPAWLEHQKMMDDAWAHADEKLIRGLKQFQKNELSDRTLAHNELFYPFSGPDTLTATLCFPDSPTYFLVALEPAGSLPAPEQMQGKKLGEYLHAVRETVSSELGKSFFVTKEMDAQFRGQVTDGLMIPTILLLVRTGHTIEGYQYERIDEHGKIVDRPDNAHVDAKYANKGFALQFHNDDDQSTHRMYYFSVNLDDAHLAHNAGFLAYVKAMPAPDTMLKATSYMTHHAEFSVIRDLVVNRSAAIFQDDSGIPYKNLAADKWNVQLFGVYTTPYTPFQYMEQADLRKAYSSGDVKPLPMRLGYGFGKVDSNLLLARRKEN